MSDTFAYRSTSWRRLVSESESDPRGNPKMYIPPEKAKSNPNISGFIDESPYTGPGIGFSFAKLLRNFCGTKRKILLLLCKTFAQITSLCTILRKNHFAQNFIIPHLCNPVLRNCLCANPLFLNVHIV